MITLYDLGAKDPIKCWSPNPWKARYVLNMKKLPYRTIYVGFEEVDRVIREAGIPPSRYEPDGKPFHSVPSIIDDATGARVTDSYKIAEYLDKQYPDTPKAFPLGTEALQAAFYQQINIYMMEFAPLFLSHMPNILSKESTEYFHRTLAERLGKPIPELIPVGDELEKTWGKLHASFDALETWYGKSSGSFLVGDVPSFGDFTVAGVLQAMKILFGEGSEDWKRLSTMNNGRWAKLLSDLEKYASVEH
ncbi:hypothetical protein D9756_009566 [Leucocoprinus leucothites]|uniref:GST N-terminal domain-containing protein n=1 Tax=Leucocoprinus leucothites TaxID=201217 RepID=A0A8H5CVU8_9AGAR|nr:hypothetical protein D9756_009566 [Leucoagaricus leucothites]